MTNDTALLIIDVQNDFCPGGSLAVADGDQVVPVLNRCIELFAREGHPILASRDWHPRVTTHFAEFGGVWPPHCVQETPGAAFHKDLLLPPQAIVISKGMDPNADSYSAFQAHDESGRPLSQILGDHGIRKLVVGGLATDYCVKSSVLDALTEGFDVELLTDAIRGVNLQPHDADQALEAMTAAGAHPTRLEELTAKK